MGQCQKWMPDKSCCQISPPCDHSGGQGVPESHACDVTSHTSVLHQVVGGGQWGKGAGGLRHKHPPLPLGLVVLHNLYLEVGRGNV